MDMLELNQLIATRAQIDLEEQVRTIRAALDSAQAEFVDRGLSRSSVATDKYRELLRNACLVRAELIWGTMSRVVSAAGLPLTNDLGDDLKSMLAFIFKKNTTDLLTQYGRVSGDDATVGSLDEMTQRALAKVNAEIDIALLAAQRPTPDGLRPATINFYNANGFFNFGSMSVNIDASTKQEFVSTLTNVENHINASDAFSNDDRREILELLADARSEATRPQVNGLRLRTLLGGLATAVQTLGSASEAYKVLKAGAALIGVHLP